MSEKYGIVTGASRGLGVGFARELARQGYNVIITYKSREDKALEVKRELEQCFGIKVLTHQLAVENADEVRALRDFAVSSFGSNLQVLVNNAGVFKRLSCTDMSPADWSDVIDINLKGIYYMCHYFAPLMIENKYGRIVNLCSAAGLRGMPFTSAYTASKFGVRGLTQALAGELGPHNITVNAVAPGSHKTDMFLQLPPERQAARTEGNPLHRIGEVEEMEFVLRYLLSSNFITGQVISMNGGTTMV